MINYIVWFDGITSYGEHNIGYYVKYKNVCSDYFSLNYIDAKRYTSLSNALNRVGIENSKSGAIRTINRILRLPKTNKQLIRKAKLSKINDIEFYADDCDFKDFSKLTSGGIFKIEKLEIEGNNITNLGDLSNKEIFDYIYKKAKKYESPNKYTDIIDNIPNIKLSTEEDIDDFCSVMDEMHENFIKTNL